MCYIPSRSDIWSNFTFVRFRRAKSFRGPYSESGYTKMPRHRKTVSTRVHRLLRAQQFSSRAALGFFVRVSISVSRLDSIRVLLAVLHSEEKRAGSRPGVDPSSPAASRRPTRAKRFGCGSQRESFGECSAFRTRVGVGDRSANGASSRSSRRPRRRGPGPNLGRPAVRGAAHPPSRRHVRRLGTLEAEAWEKTLGESGPRSVFDGSW